MTIKTAELTTMADLLKTGEAARHLGVKPGYLTNLRCWGTGPAWRRVGVRGVRYVRADLDDWMARRHHLHTDQLTMIQSGR